MFYFLIYLFIYFLFCYFIFFTNDTCFIHVAIPCNFQQPQRNNGLCINDGYLVIYGNI